MDSTAWLCCEPLSPIKLRSFTKLTLGRHEMCDVTLPHCSVSRAHAQLDVDHEGAIIKDLKSSNGTFVNGAKITEPTHIKFGDMIGIGPYEAYIRSSPMELANTGALVLGSGSFSMVGTLCKTSLAEVFQGIEFNGKTGTLHIKGKHEGLLVFKSGRPLAAKLDDTSGAEAIMKMLSLKEGSFMVSDTAEAFNEGINSSFTKLLLDYARVSDES